MAPTDTTGIPALVVTVSDASASGWRPDRSGPRLVSLLTEAGYAVTGPVVVADGLEPVGSALAAGIAGGHRMVITTGGTGFAPRDLTPEATRTVITRDIPGLAELLRHEGARHTPLAALSRGLVGVADAEGDRSIGALLVNLPGSVRAVEQGMAVLLPLLPHVLDMIVGWDDTAR